jgi:hypothetical protein
VLHQKWSIGDSWKTNAENVIHNAFYWYRSVVNVNWIHLSQSRDQWGGGGSCKHSNETSGSIWREIFWLAELTIGFSRRTLLYGVSTWNSDCWEIRFWSEPRQKLDSPSSHSGYSGKGKQVHAPFNNSTVQTRRQLSSFSIRPTQQLCFKNTINYNAPW